MLLTKKRWSKQQKSTNKTERDQKLVSINEEIKKVIKEYWLEVDKYVSDAEKKWEFRVNNIVKWFKEGCWEETDWIRCCYGEPKMPLIDTYTFDRYLSFAIILCLDFSYSFYRNKKIISGDLHSYEFWPKRL